jgi:hypothetical protein
MKPENPSACATVTWNLCKSEIALCNSVIKRTCNQGANKSNHPNYNSLFSSRVPPHALQFNILELLYMGKNMQQQTALISSRRN